MLRPKSGWKLFRRKMVREMGDSVGATYITVAVRNPHEPERVWEGEFLVDTGAVDTLVPRQHLEAMGVVPEGTRIYGLADGREIVMDIAGARIEFMEESTWGKRPHPNPLPEGEGIAFNCVSPIMQESTWGTVIFGAENVDPLLGVTALESVGIEVDPHNATLNKLPASRLRGFRPIRSGR